MWDVIDGLVTDGTTLLLTTQYLEEAERLADEIVVIDRGKVIARGTDEELKRRSGGAAVEITLSAPDALADLPALLDGLVPDGAIAEIDDDTCTARIPVTTTDHVVPAVVRRIDDAGIDVLDVVVHRPTLDDVFLQLTGHRSTDEDGSPDDSADGGTTARGTAAEGTPTTGSPDHGRDEGARR